MAICLLVRHGRTTANATGVLAGWTPGPALADPGREQAARRGARRGPGVEDRAGHEAEPA